MDHPRLIEMSSLQGGVAFEFTRKIFRSAGSLLSSSRRDEVPMLRHYCFFVLLTRTCGLANRAPGFEESR